MRLLFTILFSFIFFSCANNLATLTNIDNDSKNSANDKEVKCGVFAKMLLVKKIGSNIPKCISEGKDVYKRTLAECFVNGESLSKFLVRSGYAFAYRKYSNKFIKDEEFAQTNKIGMWSMTFQYPWSFRGN